MSSEVTNVQKQENVAAAGQDDKDQKVSTGNTTGQSGENGTAGQVEAQEVEKEEVEQEQEPGDIKSDTKPNALLRPLPAHNDGNTYYLTVDQLDPTVFPNSRTEFDPVFILELRHDFSREGGQLQEVVVSKQPDGKIAVCAGYTRTEAFNQNVYDPLIKKWNKEHGLKSTEPNFLLVTNHTHREMVKNAYPKMFEREKNKTHNLIRCNFQDADKKTAMVTNFQENYERRDLPVADEVGFIEKMITEGLKAADISKKVKGLKPPVISYMRKVGRIPAELEKILVTPDTLPDGKTESMTEADLVKLKETVTELVAEFRRRMGLPRKDEEAISISHLKEFAYRVVKDEGEKLPLTREQVMILTCLLVGADEKTHKLPKKGKSPANYAVFINRMKMMEDETKAAREGKKIEKPAAEEATATDTAEGVKAGTVEGLAAQQAADKKDVVPTTDKPETEDTQVTAEAAAAEANADKPTASAAATAAELVGANLEDLDDDEGGVITGPEVSTGKKTVAAPTVNVKVKSVDLILSAIENYKAAAAQEETEDSVPNPLLLAAAIGSVTMGQEILSQSQDQKVWQSALDDFAQDYADYIGKLEDFAEKASKKAKMKFTEERPVLNLVGLATGTAKMNAAGGAATAIDEEFVEDDDTAPSSEDLEELEDMLDGNGEESDI